MTTTSEFEGSLTTSGRDAGLVLLRLGVGLPVLSAGLRKAFDFGTVVQSMADSGWRAEHIATLMVTSAEVLGGLGLIFGILTPLAAMAVLAAMIDAWAVNVSGAAVWSDPFNFPFALAGGAAALLFTGAGRYSLDERLWARAVWPRLVAVILLVLAIAAAVATWAVFNGVNPIHFTAPDS